MANPLPTTSTSQTSSTSASGGSSTSETPIPLTPALLSTFKPAKVFNDRVEKGKSVTSISFDDRGEHCVTSSDDETLQLYNCRTGKHVKSINSKKYGVHLARFTHRSSTVIYASTKEDDTIRYHSLHDNKFLQYFKGHKKKVVSLQMSPIDDTFLSGAVDDSVRLWDLRTPTSQGHLKVQGHPVVAYDLSGKVFAVALNERAAVLLYDIRKFDQKPFLTVTVDDTAELSQISMPPRVPVITSLEFNNQGHYLLVGTAGDVHYVVDSFTGEVRKRLVGHEGLERASDHPIGMVPEAGISGQEVGWTPDGNYVVSGSATGQIFTWNVPETGGGLYQNVYPCAVLSGHEGPSRVVGFNPRFAQLCSAGNQVAFWLPESLAEE
ncbi:WD40 repeat-like protein [Violaceomyces palustris]|uniref:WD40 repeat-like protein n=1 Tax=Violaceomyces palustris TaxID=1673888 RepID=A0ACD0P7A1_9BASI|nr:WD40 repeat-like protein [Violaceomyces palustris]